MTLSYGGRPREAPQQGACTRCGGRRLGRRSHSRNASISGTQCRTFAALAAARPGPGLCRHQQGSRHRQGGLRPLQRRSAPRHVRDRRQERERQGRRLPRQVRRCARRPQRRAREDPRRVRPARLDRHLHPVLPGRAGVRLRPQGQPGQAGRPDVRDRLRRPRPVPEHDAPPQRDGRQQGRRRDRRGSTPDGRRGARGRHHGAARRRPAAGHLPQGVGQGRGRRGGPDLAGRRLQRHREERDHPRRPAPRQHQPQAGQPLLEDPRRARPLLLTVTDDGDTPDDVSDDQLGTGLARGPAAPGLPGPGPAEHGRV